MSERLSEPPLHEQLDLLDPPLQEVKDDEKLWRSITPKEERLLAGAFPRKGCTLPMGAAVYAALARIGHRKQHRVLQPSDWFEASPAELVAVLKHCQERQLRSYLKALREIGLLERRRQGRGAPNRWRLPHYRTQSRTATHCQSSGQERQPIASQAAKIGNPLPPLKERNGRENNVVRFSPRDERQARRARRAAALDSLIEGSGSQ